MGVSPGEGYGASVIDLGNKPFREETVGLGESGGDLVGEDFDDTLCLGVRGGVGADGEETTRGIGEGGGSFQGVICFSRNLCSRGLLAFLALGAPPGAGRLNVGEEVFRLVVRMLGGRGKIRQVVFASVGGLRFPRVGEHLCVHFGIA